MRSMQFIGCKSAALRTSRTKSFVGFVKRSELTSATVITAETEHSKISVLQNTLQNAVSLIVGGATGQMFSFAATIVNE